MLGQKLGGRYQIITQLGRGAFGATFVALDTQRPGNPKCVVKQFQPVTTAKLALQEAKRFFDQEAQILENLGHHDQIPQLLAHFEENKQFYLVQEFIEGHDLSQELPPCAKQLSEDEVIKLLQEILEVLAFVHQRNVIHRDIKPSNIRRRKSDGKIVLIDFGAVKEVKALEVNLEGQTVQTVAIGTPGYMATEQANRNPTFSSDVYSVGVIGIQALTGMNPASRMPQSPRTGLPTDPRTGEIIWRDRVKVSPRLANIIDKMVRYYFPGRYQSANDALQALLRLTKSKNRLNYKIALALGSVLIIFFIVIAITQVRQIPGVITNNPSPVDTNFLIYENYNYGLKIKYPKHWIKNEIVTFGDVVTFVSPLKTGSNEFPAQLSIEIENVEPPISLVEYTNSKVYEITQYLTNAKVIDSHSTILANQRAYQVIYSGKQEPYTLKRLAFWLLKNNRAYIITYTAEESQYDDYLKTAQTMINSLEIR